MKLERLEIRLPAFEKAVLERQAAAADLSLSAFVRQRIAADVTGDLLAEQISKSVVGGTAVELQKLVAALDEHRVQFDAFRAGLRTSIQHMDAAISALRQGGKP